MCFVPSASCAIRGRSHNEVQHDGHAACLAAAGDRQCRHHSEGNMTFQYVSVDEAIKRSGVRMVVVGGVPSPWGEAAKAILHVKNIEWAAVRLVYDSEPLKEWTGQRSGPILIYNNERPRAGWAEILLLSERLAPNPSLLPKDATDRALVFGLAHEICGEQGLAWSRRLQLIPRRA